MNATSRNKREIAKMNRFTSMLIHSKSLTITNTNFIQWPKRGNKVIIRHTNNER